MLDKIKNFFKNLFNQNKYEIIKYNPNTEVGKGFKYWCKTVFVQGDKKTEKDKKQYLVFVVNAPPDTLYKVAVLNLNNECRIYLKPKSVNKEKQFAIIKEEVDGYYCVIATKRVTLMKLREVGEKELGKIKAL